jgi:putative peptidoglycan lipid II flippase
MPETIKKAPGADIKRSIAIASIIMMASVLISRVMGLVREQVLAGYFGRSSEMDAYVVSFLLPELLNHLLAGGFLSITFIPIFQKYLSSGEKEKSWRVFSNLLTIGTVFLGLLVLAFMVFTGQIVALLGHSAPTELTIRLTRIIMPAQLLFYWGAFLMAVQYANNRFFFPAMLPLCYNLGIICTGMFCHRFLHMGVEGFAWGVLIGSFAGNVLFQVPGALKVGMRFRPSFKLKDPDVVKYILLTVPLVLGLGMTFSNEVFFRFFGSFLEKGSLASINYALKTMMIFVGVFGQAAGVASYPFLSRLATEKKFGEMNRLLNSITRKTACFLIPCCAIMIPLSYQIVALLYQRNHFDASATHATAPVLAVYLLGAFPAAICAVVMRSFYAEQKMIFPMTISTCIALFSIPGYILLGKNFGAIGIAMTFAIAMTLQFFVLFHTWEKRHSFQSDFTATAVYCFKITLVAALGFAVCLGLKTLWIPAVGAVSFIQNALVAAGSGIPALAVVAIALHAAKLIDIRALAARPAKHAR